MLDKLIIHLKNVLFFKIVIYLLIATILFFVIIPILRANLIKLSERKEVARIFLNQATQKLTLMSNFEENIFELNNGYEELIKNSSDYSCINSNYLISNLKSLETKYNLFQPIAISISRLFGNNDTIKKQDTVKINYYEATISFQALNPEDIIQISQEVNSLLPNGSIINYTQVKKIDVLTPNIIEKLSTEKLPGLYNVILKAYLREIVYEN